MFRTRWLRMNTLAGLIIISTCIYLLRKKSVEFSAYPRPHLSSIWAGYADVDQLVQNPVQFLPQNEHYPVEELIRLPGGKPKPMRQIQHIFTPESAAARSGRKKKLDVIRTAFQRSWAAYYKLCVGSDEVMPVTGACQSKFNGWGATLVDSLDTLWLMGLRDEFEAGVKETARIDFTTSTRADIPVFETTIRYLGGLLGAYDVSDHRYPILLTKAIELADVLMAAFDTPNRMPVLFYHWRSDGPAGPEQRASKTAALAEIGSLSLEFTRLAQLTGQDKYYDAIARITNELDEFQDKTNMPGLWPIWLDASGCRDLDPRVGSRRDRVAGIDGPGSAIGLTARAAEHLDETDENEDVNDEEVTGVRELPAYDPVEPFVPKQPKCRPQKLIAPPGQLSDEYTLGSMADSAYEYLPKEFLLLGGRVDQYKNMYLKAIEVAKQNLFFRPMLPESDDVLVSGVQKLRLDGGKIVEQELVGKASHLTCYVGGMVAMAGRIFGNETDVETGEKLTDGCIWAYNSTSTGIMPEESKLFPCANPPNCRWNESIYLEYINREEQVWILPYSRQSSASRSVEGSQEQPTPDPLGDQKSSTGQPPDPLVKRATEDSKKKPTLDSLDDEGSSSRQPPDPPVRRSKLESRMPKPDFMPPGYLAVPDPRYLLRPEALESVFYMYRITGKVKYRQAGWRMFLAIIKNTETDLAYTAISDVRIAGSRQLDQMESFWTAETLKYAYLLFSDEAVCSLDKWVFNTEAHPFRLSKK